MCPANLPETLGLESILAERCACHQVGPCVRPNMGTSRMIDQRQPRKPSPPPQTLRLQARSKSGPSGLFPLPLSTWVSLPKKSFALSAHVSPLIIHFQGLEWGPPLGNSVIQINYSHLPSPCCPSIPFLPLIY